MSLTVKGIDNVVTDLRALADFLSKHAAEIASPSEARVVSADAMRPILAKYSQESFLGARKAGETIRCVTCGGKGYVVARNAYDRRPYECRACSGSGVQTIRKPAW